MTELLDIISDQNFVPKDVAPTPHLLEKCDEFFFTTIPVRTLELQAENGTAETLQYHPLEDILKYILDDKSLTKGALYYSIANRSARS